MMKLVDFETRECSRDGGFVSPASLMVETITRLDEETALKEILLEVGLLKNENYLR